MKKYLSVGLLTALLLGSTLGRVLAVPIEYDLYFETALGDIVDIGFIIDTDAEGILKDELGDIQFTYQDSSDFPKFYHRITRISSTVITKENWYSSPTSTYDNPLDYFVGYYHKAAHYIHLDSSQDWEPGEPWWPGEPALAGYRIAFWDIYDLEDLWYDRVYSVRVSNNLTGTTYSSNNGIEFSLKPTTPVPEPTTMLLFGTGIAGLIVSRVRRRN